MRADLDKVVSDPSFFAASSSVIRPRRLVVVISGRIKRPLPISQFLDRLVEGSLDKEDVF